VPGEETNMGAESAIAWTDHTFNPWWGCHKVDPGCTNCYADTWSKRTGHEMWGKKAPRRFFGDKHWHDPIRWNERARREGKPARVFCASMADVFEDYAVPATHAQLDEARARLYDLIDATPWLDWLLLTKRIENVIPLAPPRWRANGAPPNVWIGTSTCDQAGADKRLPVLAEVARVLRPAVTFTSYEPALELVDFGRAGEFVPDWIIVGGESGSRARPFDPAWAWSTIGLCRAAGAECFVKQMGSRPVGLDLAHRAGADPSEWPAPLRVQEFPTPRRLPERLDDAIPF
jgi:protein gp37